MKRTWQRWAVVAVLFTVGVAVEGQAHRDAEFKKLADDYASAWAGTYEITGLPATPAPRGRYLNTLVLQGGRWLLAGNAAIAPPTK